MSMICGVNLWIVRAISSPFEFSGGQNYLFQVRPFVAWAYSLLMPPNMPQMIAQIWSLNHSDAYGIQVY
jgi:hypothetical protein